MECTSFYDRKVSSLFRAYPTLVCVREAAGNLLGILEDVAEDIRMENRCYEVFAPDDMRPDNPWKTRKCRRVARFPVEETNDALVFLQDSLQQKDVEALATYTPHLREAIAVLAEILSKVGASRIPKNMRDGVLNAREKLKTGIDSVDVAVETLAIRILGPWGPTLLDWAPEYMHEEDPWNPGDHLPQNPLHDPQVLRKVLEESQLSDAQWDAATEARNKWIYEHCMGIVPYKIIIHRLTLQDPAWERITSIPGIKRAAETYANRKGLPPPPPRQSGRPRNTQATPEP